MRVRVLVAVLAMFGLTGVSYAQGVLLKNVVIYDGSGKAGVRGDVRIQGDKIVEVGDKLTAKTGETVRDEHGLALAPGSAFGDAGEGYVRMCFAATEETLTRALDRFRSYLLKAQHV